MGNGRRPPGALESEVMAVLQLTKGTPLAPVDIQQRLGGDLAYTTVVTILSRMHAKGLLLRTKVGRAYEYSPVSDEPGLAARRMHQAMNAQADREAVLTRFVDSLSETDEQMLRDLLDGRRPAVPADAETQAPASVTMASVPKPRTTPAKMPQVVTDLRVIARATPSSSITT